jgi:hypothetical protein
MILKMKQCNILLRFGCWSNEDYFPTKKIMPQTCLLQHTSEIHDWSLSQYFSKFLSLKLNCMYIQYVRTYCMYIQYYSCRRSRCIEWTILLYAVLSTAYYCMLYYVQRTVYSNYSTFFIYYHWNNVSFMTEKM